MFEFDEGGADAEITIRFLAGDHNDFVPFEGPGGHLGHALLPPLGESHGELHLNAEVQWEINDSTGRADLLTTLAHEIGHLLFLEHSADASVLMYPQCNVKFAEPARADVDALARLYGSSDGGSAPFMAGDQLPALSDFSFSGLPDSDGDGLPDYVEALYFRTNPRSADTDGDGRSDTQEIFIDCTNPLQSPPSGGGGGGGGGPGPHPCAGVADGDSDGDGLSNLEKCQAGTNPMLVDTDGDGVADDVEVRFLRTNPLVQDTDGDGYLDGVPDPYPLNPLYPANLDCNANGTRDVDEIAAGAPDCNHNNVLDACDIGGYSADVNGNGIPDECFGG